MLCQSKGPECPQWWPGSIPTQRKVSAWTLSTFDGGSCGWSWWCRRHPQAWPSSSHVCFIQQPQQNVGRPQPPPVVSKPSAPMCVWCVHVCRHACACLCVGVCLNLEFVSTFASRALARHIPVVAGDISLWGVPSQRAIWVIPAPLMALAKYSPCLTHPPGLRPKVWD
jgi:hypothetical protein